MSDSVSIATPTMQSTAQLNSSNINDSIEKLTALESKLDEFNGNVEDYLFDKISDRKFSKIIESNPEMAVQLQHIMDDEATLRVKICQVKSLLQDIWELESEIKKLAYDEKVQAEREKARAERENLLESILIHN